MQEKATEDIPMPPYFRFLVLLALKIFAAEQVCYIFFSFEEGCFMFKILPICELATNISEESEHCPYCDICRSMLLSWRLV